MRTNRARRLHPWHLGMVAVSLTVLGIMTFAGSCTAPAMPEVLLTAMKAPAATVEKLAAIVDPIAATVGTVATAGKAVLDSPAGRLIPPDVKLYGSLALGLLMSGTAAYKNWRLAQMAKTTKAIVRGVEASEGTNEFTTKKAIAVEMRKLGVYDTGNKIVERFKVS